MRPPKRAQPRTATRDTPRTVTHSHAQLRPATHSHAQPRTATHSHAHPRTPKRDTPRTVTHTFGLAVVPDVYMIIAGEAGVVSSGEEGPEGARAAGGPDARVLGTSINVTGWGREAASRRAAAAFSGSCRITDTRESVPMYLRSQQHQQQERGGLTVRVCVSTRTTTGNIRCEHATETHVEVWVGDSVQYVLQL
jgi:hypothetical protein